MNCAFAVRAARRKAPKVQRKKNEWAIYFFISLFGREFSDLTELWPELGFTALEPEMVVIRMNLAGLREKARVKFRINYT
jgi:hypothetical protein